MLGVILFIIAYFLFLPLTIINYWFVENKDGYFKSSAKNLDIYANREFRTLWNKILRTENGYYFGKQGETISSALGKNQRDVTLTKKGKQLVWLLELIHKNHCIDAIED